MSKSTFKFVQFTSCAHFEYPKTMLVSDDGPNVFPGLSDVAFPNSPSTYQLPESCQSVVHPLVEAIKLSLFTVAVEDTWIDESDICFNVVVVVNHQVYGFSVWHATPQLLCEFVRAENAENDHYVQIVRRYIEKFAT